jgi:SAM-dependent methyltransferase
MTSTLYAESQAHRYLDRVPSDPHHLAIVGAVIAAANGHAGITALEVGAGRGRYTDLLVQRGLQIVAIEPDAALAGALRRRFDGTRAVRVVEAPLSDAAIASCGPFDAVLGFHVLHHLDDAALGSLDRLLRSRPEVGAGFLEPNPLNPLYPVQIALHPAMRFREERGLWRRFVGEGSPCPSLRVAGNVGLLPPALSRGAGRLLGRAMHAPSFAPWAAYRLIARATERSR